MRFFFHYVNTALEICFATLAFGYITLTIRGTCRYYLGKDHYIFENCGISEISSTTISSDDSCFRWGEGGSGGGGAVQNDLASLPSEYSMVLRSTKTISGLFGTTFHLNWKEDRCGLGQVGEIHWHHGSPTCFTVELLVFVTGTDHAEMHSY